MLIIKSDMSQATREFDRLVTLPGSDPTHLEAALGRVFAATASLVHVITGSLKNSGEASSEIKESSWTGTVAFGGPSPGSPHDPVRYARYEVQRGGTHDFIEQASQMGEQYTRALADTLKGGGL
jgi:hypothetical protein